MDPIDFTPDPKLTETIRGGISAHLEKANAKDALAYAPFNTAPSGSPIPVYYLGTGSVLYSGSEGMYATEADAIASTGPEPRPAPINLYSSLFPGPDEFAWPGVLMMESPDCAHHAKPMSDTHPATAPATHPDDLAVDRFAAAMKEKLAAARAKGRGGWDDKEDLECHLSNLLRAHVEKGDPRDVANFCCFLWNRGESIQPAPSQPADDDDPPRVFPPMPETPFSAPNGMNLFDSMHMHMYALTCVDAWAEPAPSAPADLPADLAAAVADDDAAWSLARLAVECGAEDNATDGQPQTWTLGVAAFTELARRLSSPAAVPQAPADAEALEALVSACEEDFTSEYTADEPDDEPVGYPPTAVTFGHVRRAREAIRRLSGAQQAECTMRHQCDCVGACKYGRGGNGAQQAEGGNDGK